MRSLRYVFLFPFLFYSIAEARNDLSGVWIFDAEKNAEAEENIFEEERALKGIRDAFIFGTLKLFTFDIREEEVILIGDVSGERHSLKVVLFEDNLVVCDDDSWQFNKEGESMYIQVGEHRVWYKATAPSIEQVAAGNPPG